MDPVGRYLSIARASPTAVDQKFHVPQVAPLYSRVKFLPRMNYHRHVPQVRFDVHVLRQNKPTRKPRHHKHKSLIYICSKVVMITGIFGTTFYSNLYSNLKKKKRVLTGIVCPTFFASVASHCEPSESLCMGRGSRTQQGLHQA